MQTMLRVCTVLAALIVVSAGCGGSSAPTAASIEKQLRGEKLGFSNLGTVQDVSCRDEGKKWSCDAQTTTRRVSCTVAVNDDGKVEGTYCATRSGVGPAEAAVEGDG